MPPSSHTLALKPLLCASRVLIVSRPPPTKVIWGGCAPLPPPKMAVWVSIPDGGLGGDCVPLPPKFFL